MTTTDIPLLLPGSARPFTWEGRIHHVHHQRRRPRSRMPHPNWYYLQLADGSFHEVQLSRLTRQLSITPDNSAAGIARAFQREPVRDLSRLRHLIATCGL